MSVPEHDTGLTCPRCGYNLTGLTRSECPECGLAFTIADPAAGPRPPCSPGWAFVKGGLWTLGGFLALGLMCVAVGGHMRIDPCGAAVLFVIGGLVRLVLRAVFGS
jgi:hypothetical protein